MSRIGFKLIQVPAGVTIAKDGDNVTVKGPKGELTSYFDPKIKFEINAENEMHFSRESEADKALHGTMRANMNNMVIGVTEGYKKFLSLVGVGYRAQLQGKKLILNVGYSQPVEMALPEGITVEVPSNTEIVVSGISKQQVGQFAAEVRATRPPEPYKGKGVRYRDEIVQRKEGKTGK